MVTTTDIQSDQRLRMANHYEAIVLSMALLRGDRLSDDQKGQIVNRALAATSPEEFHNPGTLSAAAVGQLHQFLIQTVEAGKPRNDFGADAARATQAAGGRDGQRGMSFGYIDGLRGSSARYRDLPAGDSMKGTGTSGGSTVVTPEFTRNFAGTGMVGGTLRTFAEVGLDRSTFDAFRREGFSKGQIADSARDSKVLGWHGRDDLSVAQHASPEARKAAVATEQATTPAQREERLKRERDLEQQNEARPDSDPQKQHNQRFFERRHQDHLRHDAKAGLGSAALEQGTAISSRKNEPAAASRTAQDEMMAKGAVRQKQVATASSRADDLFGAPVASEPVRTAPTKIAAAKPAGPAPG